MIRWMGTQATFDLPPVVSGRPAGRVDAMAVAKMRFERVLSDDGAHVAQDFFGGGQRGPDPRLELVPERVQLAVRAHAGVSVQPPGASKAALPLQHQKPSLRALPQQVVPCRDPRKACSNDDRFVMFACHVLFSLDQGGADEERRLRFKTDTYCNQKSIPFLKFPIRFSQFFFVSLFSQKKRRIETRKQMKALLVFAIVLASACLCLAAAPADGQVAVPGRGWVDPECVHQVPDGH